MTNRFLSLSLIAILAAATSLSGCTTAQKDSTKKFSGEQRNVAKVVEQLQKAAEKQDGKQICNKLLSKSVLDNLSRKKTDCSKAIKVALNDATAFELNVTKVDLHDLNATVSVTSGKDNKKARKKQVDLVKEKNTWKISAIR